MLLHGGDLFLARHRLQVVVVPRLERVILVKQMCCCLAAVLLALRLGARNLACTIFVDQDGRTPLLAV